MIINGRAMVPKRVFFTKGVGRHKHELQSFELALRDADIEQCNLVYVSSIIPPHCTIITKEKGVKELNAGEITYVVMSRNSTNEPNRLIGAAVGIAVPKDRSNYGYISEHHAFGITVVHNPSLSPSAVCATLWVRTIWPLILYSCFLLSHALSGSNSKPRVVASMVAARSSV